MSRASAPAERQGGARSAAATTSLGWGFVLCLLYPIAFCVVLIAAPVSLFAGVPGFAQALIFLPPIALNLGLAALFGRTLRVGREPLISMFARAERGTLEPDLASYTRRLTGVWVGFFIGAAVLSAGLAIFATPVVWGWFVAVGNNVAAAALFLGEYAFRRLAFPQYRHASPLALVKIIAKLWRKPSVLP